MLLESKAISKSDFCQLCGGLVELVKFPVHPNVVAYVARLPIDIHFR